MAKYYFNFENSEPLEDMEGTELDSLETAKEAASALGGEMLRDNPSGVWKDGQWMIEVADEWGVPIFRLCVTAKPVVRAGGKG